MDLIERVELKLGSSLLAEEAGISRDTP